MDETEALQELMNEVLQLQIQTAKSLENLKKVRETIGISDDQTIELGKECPQDICDTFLCQDHDEIV